MCVCVCVSVLLRGVSAVCVCLFVVTWWLKCVCFLVMGSRTIFILTSSRAVQNPQAVYKFQAVLIPFKIKSLMMLEDSTGMGF